MIHVFCCIRIEMLPGSREKRLYDVRTTGTTFGQVDELAGPSVRACQMAGREECDDRRGWLASSTLLRLWGRKSQSISHSD